MYHQGVEGWCLFVYPNLSTLNKVLSPWLRYWYQFINGFRSQKTAGDSPVGL